MSLQRREEHLDEEALSNAGAAAEGGSNVADWVSYGHIQYCTVTVSSRATLTVFPASQLV